MEFELVAVFVAVFSGVFLFGLVEEDCFEVWGGSGGWPSIETS